MPNGVLPKVRQRGLTVIADIRPAQEVALRNLLTTMNAAPFFQRIPTVHYAAFVIVPAGGKFPSRLVLETNYDGEQSAHIADLIRLGAKDLDQVYRHCQGYTPASSPQQMTDFLKVHSVPSAAFFVAFPGRSVEDIRNAAAVYREAQQFLATRAPGQGHAQVWADLVGHFRSGRATNPPVLSPTTQQRIRWRVALTFVLLLLPGILTLLFLLLLLPVVRIYECIEARADRDCPGDPPTNYTGLNVGPQNHICTLAVARTSPFRRFLLGFALRATGVLARCIFIQSTLDTITTIHFARWTPIDGGRRLLFFSNYDGSWSSYLNEFEDPPLLNAIWGNTQSFPPTRWILRDGAHLAARFEDHFIREFIPAPLFYCAYRDCSVQNLLRYLNLRDALAR
jgi:hypothetical protein